MASTIPTKESEYVAWLANFISVATNNEATLGLTMTDIAVLNASSTSVDNGISAALSAASASKAAHAVKQQSLRTSESLLRTFAKRIQANPNISDALKKQLGVNVRAANTHTPPTVPTTLMATGLDTGVNNLSWKVNGNKQSTLYVIEKQTGTASTWSFVDVTTRAKYVDENGAAGVKTAYRIYAKRNEMESGYSNTAVLYGS